MSKTRVPAGFVAADLGRLNLLTNGGFEIWQRGNGPFTANQSYSADRWIVETSGTDTLSVSKNGANVDVGSGASAGCTFVLGTGAGATRLRQSHHVSVEEIGEVGRTLSVSVRVKVNVANAVRISITSYYAGSNHHTYSSYHTGDNTWQTLTATALIDPTSTYVEVSIWFAVSCTAYVDNAMLCIGPVAPDYAPLHPADDLARCLRYYEVLMNAYGEPAGGSHVTLTNQLNHTIPYKVRKAVNPTLTVRSSTQIQSFDSATWRASTSIGITFAGLDGAVVYSNYGGAYFTVNYSSTAVGTVGGNGIAAEANP